MNAFRRFCRDVRDDMNNLRKDKYVSRYIIVMLVCIPLSTRIMEHYGVHPGLATIAVAMEVVIIAVVTMTLRDWNYAYAKQRQRDDQTMKTFQQELDDWK